MKKDGVDSRQSHTMVLMGDEPCFKCAYWKKTMGSSYVR